MVFIQKRPFFQMFFLGNIVQESVFHDILERENLLTIFYNEKTTFYVRKIKTSKSRKIKIFPKGLTHGFRPKMATFQPFFFSQYRSGKYLL